MFRLIISLKTKNLVDHYPDEEKAKAALASIHDQMKNAGAHAVTPSGKISFAKSEFVSAQVPGEG